MRTLAKLILGQMDFYFSIPYLLFLTIQLPPQKSKVLRSGPMLTCQIMCAIKNILSDCCQKWGRKDGEEGAMNSLPSRVLDKLFRTVKLYLDKSSKNFCESKTNVFTQFGSASSGGCTELCVGSHVQHMSCGRDVVSTRPTRIPPGPDSARSSDDAYSPTSLIWKLQCGFLWTISVVQTRDI
ncbi:hypothetical protein EK904_006290 [Melospiza melodia maxima]|nr:hypothetical protein EK904_006290 [Melospiza melodia maxima]